MYIVLDSLSIACSASKQEDPGENPKISFAQLYS